MTFGNVLRHTYLDNRVKIESVFHVKSVDLIILPLIILTFP